MSGWRRLIQFAAKMNFGSLMLAKIHFLAHLINLFHPDINHLFSITQASPGLRWTRLHRRWRSRDWNRFLFSDESKFNLRNADDRQRIYRRQGELFTQVCVREHDRFGGAGVIVWGGIMGGEQENTLSHSR
jgi:hypothetical protein